MPADELSPDVPPIASEPMPMPGQDPEPHRTGLDAVAEAVGGAAELIGSPPPGPEHEGLGPKAAQPEGDEPTADGAIPGDDPFDDHQVLVYELEGWGADERAALQVLLEARGITHEWEGDDLLVPEAAEDEVDSLMDEVEFPEALEAAGDGEDDEAVYKVLSDLFVAADRVAGSGAIDIGLAGELVAAAQAAAATAAPFGIDEATWQDIRDRAAALAAKVESEEPDDVIVPDAKALRTHLSRFV